MQSAQDMADSNLNNDGVTLLFSRSGPGEVYISHPNN